VVVDAASKQTFLQTMQHCHLMVSHDCKQVLCTRLTCA
jgi:hypothetical protein